MLNNEEWLHFARNLDWQPSYVDREVLFPKEQAGPFNEMATWHAWEEPFKTTYLDYVKNQHKKNESIESIRKALANKTTYEKLPASWLSALKLYAATFSLAEFAAVVGNLRAARFAPNSAWRQSALLGALDEYRHTEIPLLVMHDMLKNDGQFDWTHYFYHSNNWVAIAARHLVDELLIGSNATEFALATNFVFETGFTNLQFIGLSTMADNAGDDLFEEMIKSIQTDEARHAQIGPAVLEIICKIDLDYAQRILDKWFWRSWRLFAVVTGFSMDYFAPRSSRKMSFKEFMQEWVIEQYLESLQRYGLKKPWYWDYFLEELEIYHHMVYLSAYTYRSTVWFDLVLPSPDDLAWLASKYPRFQGLEKNWQLITNAWKISDPHVDFAVHGTSIIGFCDTCQIILSGGSPSENKAQVAVINGQKYIFCSEPCRFIFESEPSKYMDHKNVVKRVLAGEAPGNLMEIITQYFGLNFHTRGKDLQGGIYPWISRQAKHGD
jgi:toluene monooxygenase system protein A